MRRRCKTYRCPNLHDNKSGYCDDCTRKRGGMYSDNRESAYERGYDSRWAKFSKEFLSTHSVCAMCGAPATCTDHRDTPASVMLDLYGRFDLNPANYQPLCTACNNAKAKIDKIREKEYFLKKNGGGYAK